MDTLQFLTFEHDWEGLLFRALDMLLILAVAIIGRNQKRNRRVLNNVVSVVRMRKGEADGKPLAQSREKHTTILNATDEQAKRGECSPRDDTLE
jgi:hypothetical protein